MLKVILGAFVSIVACCIGYAAIYGHIAATAHSSPIKPLVYIEALAVLPLTALAIYLMWERLPWLAIFICLGLQFMVFMLLLRLFWLPFP